MSKHAMMGLVWIVAGAIAATAQERDGTLRVVVRSEGAPVAGATVTAGTRSAETGEAGAVQLQLPAGSVLVVVRKEGFFESAHDARVIAGQSSTIEVDLVQQPEVEEEVVVVASTRTGRRLEDQPTRVEVIGREEIEEKLLMTPGDIVMMLNEMGGLRVQATSPSIGAASVRVQGMKGRYGTFFSPRLSALFKRAEWTSRVSVGRGFFAATPLTEETEAAGLTRLTVPRPLKAERGTSASVDLTRALGVGSITATLFGSRIADPVAVDRDGSYVLFNLAEATTNVGVELLATLRRGPYVADDELHLRSVAGG